jgi:hypothetical protein
MACSWFSKYADWPGDDSLVLIWSAIEAEEWHGQIRFLPL